MRRIVSTRPTEHEYFSVFGVFDEHPRSSVEDDSVDEMDYFPSKLYRVARRLVSEKAVYRSELARLAMLLCAFFPNRTLLYCSTVEKMCCLQPMNLGPFYSPERGETLAFLHGCMKIARWICQAKSFLATAEKDVFFPGVPWIQPDA